MLNLPILESPYPEADPLYDISGLLGPGVRRRNPGSCWARIDRNTVTIGIRAYTDTAEFPATNLVVGLPVELSASSNTQDIALQSLFLTTDGRIFLPGNAGWVLSDRAEVSCMFTAPRRAS